MSSRRSFLVTSVGGAAGAALIPVAAATAAAAARSGESPPESPRESPAPAHMGSAQADWLDRLAAAKHKAFLDIGHFFADATPFRRANNLLDAMRTSFATPETDVCVALGFHGTGLAHVLTEATWTATSVVEFLREEGTPAAATAPGNQALVATSLQRAREMQARGALLLACGSTIRRLAARAAASGGVPAPEWEARIRRGLADNVIVVPAMIAAAMLAQERRVPYIAIG